MFGLRISQRLCAVTLAVIFLLVLSGRAQPAVLVNDELLNMLPADVLFCARINNFDYSVGRLDEFLTGASPMPLGISMLARMQLARLFGSPELAGINTAGNFALFGVLKADSKASKVCALIAVTDYKKFIEGNSNVSQPDANGLSKITISAAPMPPDAGPLKPAEAKTAGFVVGVGSFALLSKSPAGLSAMAGSLGQQGGAKLAGVLSAGQAKQAAAQRLWAYGNIQLASKTYGRKLLDKLDRAKEKIKSIESPTRQSIEEHKCMNKELGAIKGSSEQFSESIKGNIEKLREQQAENQAKIEKLKQHRERLAEIEPDQKNQVAGLDRIIRERKEMAQSIGEQIAKLESMVGSPADTGAVGNQELAEIDRAIEQAEKKKAEPAAGWSMEVAANAMDAYADILRTLMDGAKSVTISSSPKPDVLNITAAMNTVAGTELAALFGTDGAAQPVDNKLPGYLEDGAAANGIVRMDSVFWRKFISDKAMGFAGAIFGGRRGSEDISKMMNTAAEMSGLVSNAVFSVSAAPQAKPPFKVIYVYALKDPQRYVRLLKESLELYNTGMSKFYDEMGMQTGFKFDDAADNYKGVPIYSMSFDMKMADANSPQVQMLRAMYGKGLNYKYAVVEKNLFTTVGPDPNSSIRKLIDTAQAGGPAKVCSEITQAMSLVPDADKADFLGTLNVLRMAKMITAFVPMPMPALPDVPTASNLVFAGRIADGSFALDIALPKQHLMEITTAVQMKMQQQMQHKGRRPPSSTPPAAAPPTNRSGK